MVSVLTRTPDSDAATFVEAANGRIIRQEPRGGPVGTTVAVEELFDQTPARKKFLRTPRSELSRVNAVITNYALAYPDVRFTLIADGRTPFTSPGGGDLREAAAAVYGREPAQAFLAVEIARVQQHRRDGPAQPAGVDARQPQRHHPLRQPAARAEPRPHLRR